MDTTTYQIDSIAPKKRLRGSPSGTIDSFTKQLLFEWHALSPIPQFKSLVKLDLYLSYINADIPQNLEFGRL
jgi:hypothetical protein